MEDKMSENKSRVCCFYDYADKCDCAEDDRCCCNYPNNTDCSYKCVKSDKTLKSPEQPLEIKPNTVCFCSPKDCDCSGNQKIAEK